MKKYQGVFERIKNKYPELINERPLYYKEAAELYDQISIVYDDYPMFLQQAVIHGGPILELCCGSGRLTLPLLKAGFRITAVDLSEDMLLNLRQQLEKNKRYEKYKNNVSLVCQDMTKLDLDETYNIIMIGATSIRLMEKDFIAFFNEMHDLLNPGGCLFFNIEDLPASRRSNEAENPMGVFDFEEKDGKLALICMQRFIDYEEKRATVNFIKIVPGTEEKILLSQTEYRIFGKEDIEFAAEKSKFGSCEIIKDANSVNYFCRMLKKN
ncbi:MAG: class I SAM-dependent methyltransferase [Clostridia bacterium]|nr:class I SAM-dependent methyltransferase [Clostridia bacterium]